MMNIKNLDISRLTVIFYLFAVAVKKGRYAGGDCNSKCGALYGFTGFDFTYCLDECRIGGQKLLPDYKPATSNSLPAHLINSGKLLLY
jgi:hypothetical protein